MKLFTKKKYSLSHFLLKYLFIFFLSFMPSFAATQYVGCASLSPNNTTIQDAINAASDGDTVSICDGTYTENNIQITKNNLIIQGYGGNRDNVIVGKSSSSIFSIQAANATLKNLTINSTSNNAYGITDNNQASGNHTFENLSISTKDNAIYLQSNSSAATFKNLSITSSSGSGIYTSDGAHSFSDISISAKNYGIYAVRGAGSFLNMTINSGDNAIYMGSKYPATFDTITLTSTGAKGISIQNNTTASNSYTISNATINAKLIGIDIAISGKNTIRDSNITSSNDRGINFQWDANGAHELSNLVISAKNIGIYSQQGLGILSNILLSSSNGDGIYVGEKYPISASNITVTQAAGKAFSINTDASSGSAHSFTDLNLTSKYESLYVAKSGKLTIDTVTATSTNGDALSFASDSQGAHEIFHATLNAQNGSGIIASYGLGKLEDFNITAKNYGISLPNNENNTIKKGFITTTIDTGINITSGSGKSVVIEDTVISAGHRGINLLQCSSATINNVCITKASIGIFTAWDAYNVSVTNTKIDGNSDNGVSIESSSSYKATLTNNCFLKSPFANRNNTAHTFDGNYWNGTSPSGYDASPLTSCPVSFCYGDEDIALTPIAEYRFDECDNTSGFKDEIGNYNASLLGSVSVEDGEIINNAVSIISSSGTSIDSAIDTTIDIDDTVGDKGSISFWYKSNTNWIGGGVRTLLDASGTAQYFFLTLDNAGKLNYGLENQSDADYRYTTSAFDFTADTWTHVTVIWNMSNKKMQLFVNNTLALDETVSSNESLGELDTLYIGDNRGTYVAGHWPSGYNGESANGLFDEFKIFDSALSSTEVANIFTNENNSKNYDGTSREPSNCNITPIADFRFDECSWDGTVGEVIDSIADYNATSVNGANVLLEEVINNAGDFTDNKYIVPSVNINLNSNHTVSAWVKFPLSDSSHTKISGRYYYAFGSVVGGGDLGYLWSNEGDINTVGWGIWDGSSSEDSSSLGSISDGWHHIALVSTSSGTSFFLDGVLKGSTSIQTSGEVNYLLTSGDGPDEQTIGTYVDELKIYDFSLNLAQINSIYENDKLKNDYNGNPREIILCECSFDTSDGIEPLEFEGGELELERTLNNGVRWTAVDFNKSFTEPPVVFALLTSSGGNPAEVYIKDVTTTGFKAIIAEPFKMDGPHVEQKINYLAINKGLHKIGTSYFEVGSIETDKYQQSNTYNEWEKLTTKISGCSNPAIVTNKQTVNNETGLDNIIVNDKITSSIPFLSTIAETNSSGIYVALEMSETTAGSITAEESIGYMIASPNIQDSFVDDDGKTINFETIRKDKYFKGWGSCENVDFINSFSQTPLVAASKVGRIESDGGWVRSCFLDESKIGLTIDEDTDTDNERNHIAESASIFAFSENFVIRDLQTCYTDSFNRSSIGSVWSIIKNDIFTPQIIDNKLMLTNKSGNVAAGITLSGNFPSNNNLVEIEFENNAYGGSGADGATVILSDGNVTPIVGGFGGSLGYAPKSSTLGFAGAWLGFGLDEFGNFAKDADGNKGRGCVSPYVGTSFVEDSVTIRGRGDSNRLDGYCFIANSGNLLTETGVGIDDKASAIPAPKSKYKFVIDTRSSETKITVLRDSGSGYVILPNMDEVNATQSASAPPSFRLSFTGSTGGANNYHSFDDLKIKALSCGTLGEEPDPEQAQFDAWNTDTDFTDRFISTKIAGKSFDLTIGSLNDTFSGIQDFNGTVCSMIVDETNTSLSSWQKLLFEEESTKNATFSDVTKATKNARALLTWKDSEDADCPLLTDFNTTLSSDNFAIRPDRFDFTVPLADSYAGETFSLDIKALDDLGNATSDYNETQDTSFEINAAISKSTCTNGTFNLSSFSFADGIQNVDANYSENGDVNITIVEIVNSEYAIIDKDDTSDNERFITPVTKTITIDPYELNVTSADFTSSNGQDWLYMADVADMNVTASATVQANNKLHQPLQNFISTCYASDVDLSFYYDVSNPNTDANISYIPVSLGTEESLSDINKTLIIPASDFIAPSADVEYSFNVNRAYDTPLNPIDITLTDVKVTSTNVAKDENNATLSAKKSFYYGRINTKDVATNEQDINHEVKIEIYKSSTLSGFKQNTINWYEMKDDNTTSIDLITPTADFGKTSDPKSLTINQTTNQGVIDLNIINAWSSSDSAYIHLDIPSYLWYNKYSDYNDTSTSDCSQHPCFRYIYNTNTIQNRVSSGAFEGSSLKDDGNFSRSYEKKGVKTFR